MGMTVHEATCLNYDLLIIKQNKILGQYCHTMGIHIHFDVSYRDAW